jgi:hypothetical protein
MAHPRLSGAFRSDIALGQADAAAKRASAAARREQALADRVTESLRRSAAVVERSAALAEQLDRRHPRPRGGFAVLRERRDSNPRPPA